MYWVFYTYFVKFAVKNFFITYHTFLKSCDFFIESHFQAKIATFYCWFY